VSDVKPAERGPFRADQIGEGDRYELSRGHSIYVAPTGGSGAGGTLTGGQVLGTDPLVTEAGIDAGYSPEPGVLRAPDVAVGNVPDAPGWISGAPPLAVEYADRGQNDDDLQTKIAELLEAGTRWVWVVRLVGPRRVEVHSLDAPVVTYGPGQELLAEGVLQNPVPVEALWDREIAHEVVLRNLLQRKGYASLEDVREQGIERGRAEALRTSARALCEVVGIELAEARQQHLDTATAAELERIVDHIRRERGWPAE
jgi:hypothetical protein